MNAAGRSLTAPYGELPAKGQADAMDVVFASNYTNPMDSANHTAVDTLIWSNHPECGRAADNTELFGIMKDFMDKMDRF